MVDVFTGERKQSFQFTVHTESSWNRRPDYVIAAQSENEMKEWIAAFKVGDNFKPWSLIWSSLKLLRVRNCWLVFADGRSSRLEWSS